MVPLFALPESPAVLPVLALDAVLEALPELLELSPELFSPAALELPLALLVEAVSVPPSGFGELDEVGPAPLLRA